jgi:hypothetical protein
MRKRGSTFVGNSRSISAAIGKAAAPDHFMNPAGANNLGNSTPAPTILARQCQLAWPGHRKPQVT